MKKIKVSIMGANGYTGLELLSILAAHPKAELVYAVSRSQAGRQIASIYPSLLPFLGAKEFSNPGIREVAAASDVVFTALPHTAAAEIAAQLLSAGVKVIDLSADFRYSDVELYERTYKAAHPAKELCAEAVYGITELFGSKVKKSRLVANPGCYTTCSILPLYPLLKNRVIKQSGIIIDAKSGISGAGRKDDADYGYCETAETLKAYAVTTHRHTSEIEEKLGLAAGAPVTLSFTPHLLPVKRGILSTIYADFNGKKGAAEAEAALNNAYKKSRFVKVLQEGTLPEIKNVAGSNFAYIGFKADTRLNKLIIVSCLDNLIKGASGQAVQNMNLMFGIPEDTGLGFAARHL